MSIPRKQLIDQFSRTYRNLMRTRPLTDEEWEELRPWVTTREEARSDLTFLSSKLKAPETAQLLRSCQGEDEVDKRSIVFDKTGLLLNKDIRACYRRLFELAGTVLLIMGPRENEDYIPPATRMQRVVTALEKERKTSQPDIEEAVWFIISCLYGNKFADVKTNCMTLVQIELAKLNPEEAEKLVGTLKDTFETFKQLATIYQTFEIDQRKVIRENSFGLTATIKDSWGIENGEGTPRSMFRSLGGFASQHILTTEILSDVKLSPLGWSVCAIISFGTCMFDVAFPIKAEIVHDEQGDEVVRYTPHPLRSKAKLGCDLLSAIAIAYVACEIFSYFL